MMIAEDEMLMFARMRCRLRAGFRVQREKWRERTLDLFGAIPKNKKSNKKRMTVMDKIKIFEGSVGNESEKKSKERSSNKGENYKSTSVCVGPDRKRLPGW